MPKPESTIADDLPPLINELAAAIGMDAAMSLFMRFKGRHLTIPLSIPPGHVISETIGADKAALLCKTYSGELMMFPKGDYLFRKRRDKQILTDWQGGMKQCDLATKYQLTERRINAIINTKHHRG